MIEKQKTESLKHALFNRALLVGINHYYLDDAIGNLQFCVNDVVELNVILSDTSRGNFTTQLLHSEVGDKKLEPNRSNIMSMTKLLANNSGIDDSVLFYFASHGSEQNGINYLLPADSRLNVLAETAISLGWVKDTLSKSLARRKFLIIDACHAGARLGRSQTSPMTDSFQEEMFSNSKGFAVLSSCQIDELSYDWPERNHGVFSYYLLEALKGAADYDSDQIITVPDVNRYISTKIREWSISKKLQQTPKFLYDVSGDFIFVKAPSIKTQSISNQPITAEELEKSSIEIIHNYLVEISFMSFEDAYANRETFDSLESYISHSDDRVELSKSFLEEFKKIRLSDSYAKLRLMRIVEKVTEQSHIKKWLKNQVMLRQYLLLEFVGAGSFDYAGTMAQIVVNMLPVLSEEELSEVIKAIEDNSQISNSFKAQSYLLMIIDACKNFMPIDKYKQLIAKYK